MTQSFIGTHTTESWRDWELQNVQVTEEGISLAVDRLPAYVSPQPSLPALPSEIQLVDFALDNCNDLYVLADSGSVFRVDPEIDRLTRLACTWDDGLEQPVGIAVTADTIYVAQAASSAAGADGRVQAVAKRLLHHRWTREKDIDDPIALDSDDETVYLLDAGTTDDGSTGRLCTLTRAATLRTIGSELAAPRDLAIDREGNQYVLEEPTVDEGPASRLTRFDAATLTEDVTDTVGSVLVAPDEFQVSGSAESFTPHAIEADHDGEVLIGVGPDANAKRSLFRRQPADGTFERIASFNGRIQGLLLERDRVTCEPRRLHALGGDGRSVVQLTAKTARSINQETKSYSGHLLTRFDSGIRGCQWDRLLLDHDESQGGTRITVRYLADDEPVKQFDEPIDVEAVDGIGPIFGNRLRSAGIETLSELILLDPSTVAEYTSSERYTVSQARTADWIAEARQRREASGEVEWQTLDVVDPTDALFEEAVGRYLWIKLELTGERFSSPVLESFRAYFPRQSYLRHMPAVYQEDQASAEFLERFLSIFESVFVDIEEDIGAIARYLDPQGIPAEYVPWLERWLALDLDETWPIEKRRLLLEHAPSLFKYRGTPAGLRAMIQLFLAGRLTPPDHWEWALDQERTAIERQRAAGAITAETADAALKRRDRSVFITEHAQLSCLDSEVVRSIYERLIPCPQCFAVLLPPYLDNQPVKTVERIVGSQQPAHTTGRTIQLQPWIQLAGDEHDQANHTYLGVNSALVEREFVLQEATLGRDAVLREHESDGQLGLRSRLGTDTRMS